LKYNIDKNNLSKVFYYIKNEINENEDKILELIKIDNKYNKMQVNLEMFMEIINNLEHEEIEVDKEQKIYIRYNGNPCITLNLSILAILTKTKIILDFNNCMLGINTLLIRIVNNILKKLDTDELIFICDNNDLQLSNVDKIICIDDINKYNQYMREKNSKVRFYSLNYLDFYNDTAELEDLAELIYKYAEDNQISIESYSELEPEEAVQMIKRGLGSNVVVLTNNMETKQVFESNIKNKKLYINQNPFKKERQIINKEILYM